MHKGFQVKINYINQELQSYNRWQRPKGWPGHWASVCRCEVRYKLKQCVKWASTYFTVRYLNIYIYLFVAYFLYKFVAFVRSVQFGPTTHLDLLSCRPHLPKSGCWHSWRLTAAEDLPMTQAEHEDIWITCLYIIFSKPPGTPKDKSKNMRSFGLEPLTLRIKNGM